VWDGVPGIPSLKGFYGFQTGNGSNLAGTIGLYDPLVNLFDWMTNANNDFCVQVPGTSANFSTCTGYHFRVVKSTGEVDTANNVLDDGSGNAGVAGAFHASAFTNPQVVTLTPLAGAGTSPTGFNACDSGVSCNPNSGSVSGTVGSAPPSTGDVVKIAWSTTAFARKALCIFQVYDNTAGAVLNTFTQDIGGSTTTQAEAFTASALTAGHSIGIHWACP
jgi:hypothetical protein